MDPEKTTQATYYNSLYRHGVDEKRRIQIPAKWRPAKVGVEFTLVLPLVMLVLFGIIEFGTGLKAANDYTNVANQVARYAAEWEGANRTENTCETILFRDLAREELAR